MQVLCQAFSERKRRKKVSKENLQNGFAHNSLRSAGACSSHFLFAQVLLFFMGRRGRRPLRYTNIVCTNFTIHRRGDHWSSAKNDKICTNKTPMFIGTGVLDCPQKMMKFVRIKTGGSEICPYGYQFYRIYKIDYSFGPSGAPVPTVYQYHLHELHHFRTEFFLFRT